MNTSTLIKFKFGEFQQIKDLGQKNQSDLYFATNKPALYSSGVWYGVTSLKSQVNEDTGEVTITVNGDFGNEYEKSQVECKFVAGMTTQQKADLEKAVSFVKTFEDPNIDNTKDVIDKWNEIVAFLAGFKETDVLLDRISTLETNVTNLQNTTITGGDGLKGGGNLTGNRTIALGTPSTITDSSTNSVTTDSHTHAIDEASTEQRGIVRLNDSLTSTSTDQALTANQGKVLDGKVKGVADLLNDMFEKVTDNGKTYIKTKYGFASDKFVSAGGTDDTESGGGGGANLTQIWESLQGNSDTFANTKINKAHIPTLDVDHIPTLTTGKISDFVSATQAIADTAVANKADKATTLEGYGIKDAVKLINNSADDVRNTSAGFAHISQGAKWGGGLWTVFSSDKTAGIQINVNAWANKTLATRIYNNSTGTWYDWHEVAFKETTLSGYGITDAVTLNTDQTITGGKTFSNLKVSNTNLVTNLNAEMVGGYDSFSLFTSETIGDVNAPNKKARGSWIAHLAYNCSNVPSSCDDGKIVHFSTNLNAGTSFQLASSYYGNTLFFRSGNLTESSQYYLYNKAWKKVAFTDNVLPLTGGTLTGALTVNAPINNTGALKLLGASEVSSTGMAVGSGAKALGSNSRSLSEYSHAGLRTGNSNYPSAIISPYDLLPFTVNGETVYGTPIKANSSLTYKYNGISYTVENTTNYTQVLVLISVGSDFVAGVTHPLNKCALTYSKGYSLGRGQKIHAISELSDTVRAITIYTWVKGSTDETNFINNFVISNSNKFYTYKGVSLSTQSGDYSVASGANSVASGYASVASGYASVASGAYSVASGYASVASGNASVASGDSSVASGAASVASGNASVASGAYSVASGANSVASGAASVASGVSSVASGANSVASGVSSVASHESSKVFATRGISGKAHQTVLGYYNAEDANSVLVVGWGQGETARKNVFTVDAYGYVRMGNRLHIGVGGQNELYLHSNEPDQLYVHTSAGIPLLIQKDFIRRGIDAPKTTLGTNQYKWYNVFTESLKIADANLTYDIGTLTIDKALTVASTLTATQGEFANYVKIGNATISWNPKGYLEINEGLASHKFISAGGVVTGDAGGGGGGLSLTDMWVSLNGNIDAYGKSKIHIDHIPLDVILSHDDYENDVANRINTFNYNNSSSFTSAVKALIVAGNIPTLEMSKIDGLEDTLTNIGTVVQNNYETLSNLITNNHNDHEARIKAIEQALTWQTV